MAQKRRIGIYVCHCGGNISDHVNVKEVADALEGEAGVEVSRTHMFACSDASQQEMIDEIKEKIWMAWSSPRVPRSFTCSRSAPWPTVPG